MDIVELAQFLTLANKATYANKRAIKTASSRFKSEDYQFEKGHFVYHDTYFGDRDFIGEEIVYKQGFPIWGANYFGFIFDECIHEKNVYSFLREALMMDCADTIPVRGPSKFSFENKEYCFTVVGDLVRFSGEEKIFFDGKEIYKCLIHGGIIR